MRDQLDKLLRHQDITVNEARDLALGLLDPQTPDAFVGAVLAALRAKGETAPELEGFVAAMLSLAHGVAYREGEIRVDTCGTGGDGADTFNISTAAALLCAAAGERVFKHGNRAASSRCGSADVIEALGVAFAAPGAAARHDNFRFLFAPAYHPALKRLAPVRRALGFRTIFNLVGPLANPAAPTHQLVGVGASNRLEPVARALAARGVMAFVVWGEPGLDEATPAGPFKLLQVGRGDVSARTWTAADFGLPRCDLADLRGGDAAFNARLIEAIFDGERGARRDAVVLNSALVFLLTGRATSPGAAARLAESVIDNGAAAALLASLREAPCPTS